MSTAAYSQVPEPRVVASPGVADPFDPENLAEPVWETWIAAGSTQVVSVHQQEVNAASSQSTRIAYAVYSREAAGWIDEGIIPQDPNGVEGVADPSIVWLGEEPDVFAVCAVVYRVSDGKLAVGVARYSGGEWSGWKVLTAFSGSFLSRPLEKPWIVAGGCYPEGRELYVTFLWREDGHHSYRRSRDGGITWTPGDITFGLGGDYVEAAIGLQPTVAGDGPLYVAYRLPGCCSPASREIHFLEGIDIDDSNDSHVGEVEFRPLYRRSLCMLSDSDDPTPAELVVTRNRTQDEIAPRLPGGKESEGDGVIDAIQTIPFVAADPTDPNQICLAYHDTSTDDPNDMDINIYFHSLRRYRSGWCGAAERIKVNDDPNDLYEADQLLPAVAVDDDGRVHVIFYDDRRYNIDSDQLDGSTTAEPKYDVYYAYSDNHGASFHENRELAKDPDDPNEPDETCLDYGLFDGFDLAPRCLVWVKAGGPVPQAPWDFSLSASRQAGDQDRRNAIPSKHLSDADGHTGSTARIARPCLRQNERSRPPVSVRPQEIARRLRFYEPSRRVQRDCRLWRRGVDELHRHMAPGGAAEPGEQPVCNLVESDRV